MSRVDKLGPQRVVGIFVILHGSMLMVREVQVNDSTTKFIPFQ